MATKRTKQTKDKHRYTKEFNGYVDVHLTSHDKDSVNALVLAMDLPTILEGFTTSGFKVTARFDGENDCFRVDVLRCFTGYGDVGYMFTARHKQLLMCYAQIEHVIMGMWDGKLPAGEYEDFDW